MAEEILRVEDARVHFPVRAGIFSRRTGTVYAVDGVSFSVKTGETLGLVGESGCGKTTLGRALLGLYALQSGSVNFDGTNVHAARAAQLKALRRQMQMVFQDPMDSLNARHTVGSILEEPFVVHGIANSKERKAEVGRLLNRVGLPGAAAHRFPFEFSGGQRQRIGIARAIALKPKFIVCDEPVSALDVSVQSQILNLLVELQQEMHMSYVFIAHGLPVVRHMADRVAVMYLGRIVEIADSEQIYRQPLHPYTRALLAAIPDVRAPRRDKKTVVQGEPPSPLNPPAGCHFHPRCPHAQDVCRRESPVLRSIPGVQNHQTACHFAGDL